MIIVNHNSPSQRIQSLRRKTLSASRYLSCEQARIITRVYRENNDASTPVLRALSLAASLDEITIVIDPEELIVGNRTPGIRAGVVFPEAGISWLAKEIHTLHKREQDSFMVRDEDIGCFFREIEPFWKGRTLEDKIFEEYGDELKAIEKVVKINQKDHAQGHICPDVARWLRNGPSGLLKEARIISSDPDDMKREFRTALCIVLEASARFILRYARLAEELAHSETDPMASGNLKEIASVCYKISQNPPETFREALQSVWFLFVILHMESNASSFSPGRLDQILLPYFLKDKAVHSKEISYYLELIDALYIKFNQIVYMRNSHSARYFAGFPIGFNVTVGGKKSDGTDAVNELSYLFLKAQEHVMLPQPNLTARIHRAAPEEFLKECSRVIGLGTGMPQIVNDESIIPSLVNSGIEPRDATDYTLVGCVELSTQGNFLGWSDAAMFNLVKVLELALNNGICMLSGNRLGPETGTLTDHNSWSDLENAFRKQTDSFIEKMVACCEVVEKFHQLCMPSAFLSSVVNDCIEKGIDVTRGGAKYNYSGIQAIQVANIADSLAVLREMVFEKKQISKQRMLNALRTNFKGEEELRLHCLESVPKYGNDIEWVDLLGQQWTSYFAEKLKNYRNYRGGRYHMGLYTVSAHVPMGHNVGATPDGRLAGTPLADGGLSPVYGRDKNGPTAVLKSVSRVSSAEAGNGTLLNLKFLPSGFADDELLNKFTSFLRSFSSLPIHHVQFNVVTADDLRKAKADPESYRGLTIRVAGYTAYFTELSPELQDEIIERTSHGEIY